MKTYNILRQKMKKIFIFAGVVAMCLTFINFAKYPELYSSKLKYQLYNDLKNRDTQAEEYYSRVYVQNGKKLFSDF